MQDTDISKKPRATWDGERESISAFYESLAKELPQRDVNYRLLIEHGVVLIKGHTVYPTAEHLLTVNSSSFTPCTSLAPFQLPARTSTVLSDKELASFPPDQHSINYNQVVQIDITAV